LPRRFRAGRGMGVGLTAPGTGFRETSTMAGRVHRKPEGLRWINDNKNRYERMTADNNSTEDKPDPTPFKVYPMMRSKRMRGGPTREFASKEEAIKFAGRQVGGYYAVYQRGRKIWP
jgi:hypothetical protein